MIAAQAVGGFSWLPGLDAGTTYKPLWPTMIDSLATSGL